MSFNTESAFTRWYCEMITTAGAETVAFVGSRMQRVGIADRYVCHPTFRGWVESKRGSNVLGLHQKLFMKRLVTKGDCCLVIRYHPRNDTVEFEDLDGNETGWLDLRTLRSCNDVECGRVLLHAFAKAWKISKGETTG